jgi:hypothetical protein
MSNVFCQKVTARGLVGEDALKKLADTIANHPDVKGVPDDFFTFGKTEDGLPTLTFTAKHHEFTEEIVREFSSEFQSTAFIVKSYPSVPHEIGDFSIAVILNGLVVPAFITRFAESVLEIEQRG